MLSALALLLLPSLEAAEPVFTVYLGRPLGTGPLADGSCVCVIVSPGSSKSKMLESIARKFSQ